MTEHAVHLLSGAYAVGALDDLERAHFEAHLATCADCRAEVAGLREATTLLAETSAVAPPSHVRDAVLAGIATVRPLPPVVGKTASHGSTPGARRASGRRWFPALAAAAAVVAAVGAGIVVYDQVSDDESSQGQLTAADRVLTAPDAERVATKVGDATATVVVSRSQGKAVLLTEDMPAAPSGKVYELWLQTPEDDMVPAGLMPQGPTRRCSSRATPPRPSASGSPSSPRAGRTSRRCRPSPSSSWRDPSRRRRRIRRRRSHRGVRPVAAGQRHPRHPLRGRRPPRRPRRHARRRRAGRAPGHRHRVHRPQRAHLPRAAAALRRARGDDSAVRDVHVDQRPRHRSRVGRRPRSPWCGPHPRPPRRRGVPADAHRHPTLPPTSPSGARRRPARHDAEGVPARGSVHAVLHPPLHGAPRRGGVVVRPGGGAGLPRSLPLRLPRAPRHARCLRLPDVAHGDRRLARVRRPRGRRPAGRADRHQGHLRPGDRCRGRGHRRQRHRDDVRRRRGRDPSRPRADDARRAHVGPARGAGRDAVLRQHRAAAHRHLAAAEDPQHPGVVELPPPRRRGQRPGDRDLRPDPAAAAAHRHALPGDPRRRRPGRPRHGDRPDGVRAPALHPGVRGRAGPAPRDRQRARGLRRRLPRLGIPRGRSALRPRGGREAGCTLANPRWSSSPRGTSGRIETAARTTPPSPTPAARPSGAPSPTARASGWSTSTTSPRPAGGHGGRAASRRATTWATRMRRCAPTSRPSSTCTGSSSPAAATAAGS